jgi:cytochrome c553
MHKLVAAAVLAACVSVSGNASAADASAPPLWAWGFTTPAPATPPAAAPTPAAPAAAPDPTLHKIPGSQASFTRAQISNRHAPADWFPEDHPVMPEIVAKGRASANPPIYACGLCHMPNGKGRPENANVTGLTYEYIMQQLADFAAGKRRTTDKRKTNTGLMEGFAKQMTREEMETAARYFASIPATPWVKVIESETAPKTRTGGGVFFALTGKDAGTEPLGNRIIETPVNNEDFEVLRNPRSGFIAYVPVGSLKKGEALVKTGGGKMTACTVCHGADLRGAGPVPTLAGRSPSYLVRQMYDMQQGNRAGAWSPLMAPVVSAMTTDDMLIAAAYLASLTP